MTSEADDFSNLLINFTRIWEDFMDVSWTRQLFDGRKVLKYQLSALGEKYRVERYFTPNESSFRLLGLSPQMEITVQVRVLVESPQQGPVWCAWASNVATTLKAAELSVGSVSSESLHGKIKWGSELLKSGPTPSHCAAAASKFQVKIRQKGRVLSNDVCDLDVPATSSEFSIRDIEKNSVFELQCRAVSVYDDVGRWCDPVRFLTLCPVMLKVTEIGETYSIIRWDRSDDDDTSTAEGSIEELVVVAELYPNQRERDVDPQAKRVQVDAKTFSNETRIYRIKNLLPGRTYFIRSRYRNVLGDWTDWSASNFNTLQPVRSVDVNLVGHNFIQIHWQREEGDDGSFDDTAKDVDVWEIRCGTGTVQTSTTLPKRENETKLVNLHPGIDYTIDVRAQTHAGEWGLWSIPVTVSTLHRLSPRVEVAGETWLSTSWDRKEKQYNDNITRYHIQLNCVSSPFRLAKYFPATTTSYRFENLKPGTKYLIAMQAFSDNRWGPWSEPSEISTCAACLPTLIRRGEDFVQVRWKSDYYIRNAVESLDQTYQLRVKRPPLDAEGEAVAPTEVFEEELTQSVHRIAHLSPFSRIILQVRCFDYMMQTWCSWGPECEFRTLPSVVLKTHVGETFVNVSWSRAPRILSAVADEDFDKGIEDPLYPETAKQYILRLNAVDENGVHRETGKYHFDDGQVTIFTVNDLKPDTQYSLQLSFLDLSGRWSPQSAPIKFRTIPPLAVRVLDVGEGYCSLQWGRWSRGKEVAAEDDGNFKIVVTVVSGSESVPMQFNVNGTSKYAVHGLTPSTLYRIQVASSPSNTTVYGDWSEPVFAFTTPAMEIDLELVGEDFAQVIWKRLSRKSILSALPDSKLTTVTWQEYGDAPPMTMEEKTEGHQVFIGEETVREYHVQMFELVETEIEIEKKLIFEAKLHSLQTGVRIPALTANTPYEAYVAAAMRSQEWGCWSNALAFRTSMPTEVRVKEITQDAVRIIWGKGGEENSAIDHDILRYQLRVQGINDEYLLEVEKAPDECFCDIKGLSINACYSVTVRGFLKSESEWGQWCHKIYVVLRVVLVELVEASQDWVHLCWPNKVAADNRIKSQFLTLLGEESATITTLDAAAKTHIFHGLTPSTIYTAHLLTVEQSPVPVKVEAPIANPSKTLHTAQASQGAFAIPLVSADVSSYIIHGFSFRTQRMLELNIERVGQNFVLLKWNARVGDESEPADVQILANELFEVEVAELDSDKQEGNVVRSQGNYMFVRHLRPDSTVRCAVRWVARHSEVPCRWSSPVVAHLLPMIEPLLGPGDGTDMPGIGEDYLIVHWTKSLRNSNFEGLSGISFEVRVMQLEGTSAFADVVSETSESKFHAADLNPDTKYQIQVRTLIEHKGISNETEIVKGEWSNPLVCTTLSPMAVAVTDVVEVGSVVHWRRKNCAVGDVWWQDVPAEVVKQEIATISSFHIRVTTGTDGTGTAVFEEQFGEHHTEFAACAVKLKSLNPGCIYSVSVRASTGMLWGAWSAPVVFCTQLPALVSLPAVGETWIAAEWSRQQTTVDTVISPNVHIGSVTKWELSFTTVGSTKTRYSVLVSRDQYQQVVGDLASNCAYTLCIRPQYKDEDCGPWSIPVFFVTLAPFRIEVGKVGETFAQVSWEREPQQTITSKMRYKHLDAMREFDSQLRDLEERLASIREGSSSPQEEAPTTMENLDAAEGEEAGKEKASVEDMNRAADERFILDQIEALKEKIANSKKLSQMQVAEVERNAVYPKGEDQKYELVLQTGDESVPVRPARRLGKGEHLCRLENLTTKTTYYVFFRSLYTNEVLIKNFALSHVQHVDEDSGFPWGSWSQKSSFVTLKPISISTRGVGSEGFAVEWDTGLTKEGSSSRTAITKFQIHLTDNQKKAPQRPDITLDDSSLKGHVVGGLESNSVYTAGVRVCYEGDKWGVWSAPIQFITLPKLLCKLHSVAERQIEFLIWRDVQLPVEKQETVIWKPVVTDHQIAINSAPCNEAFALEANTSTLLTLDTLAIDTEYTISVRDKVVEYWQDFKEILQCETIPHAPQRPTLLERKGVNVVIGWNHRRNLEHRQYIYMVEMALRNEVKRGVPDNFMLLGFTKAQEYRMELVCPIHDCFFRVKVCKTSQTIDGEPHPVLENSDDPQDIVVDSPNIYVWSMCSPVAHFKTPSVPDHPTGLNITNLCHNAAVLHWNKPDNFTEHSNIIYRVYLNNSYLDKFTCIGETTKTCCPLNDLLPNCHYRVSVAAESTMGSSMHNNTLHFSTHVNAEQSRNNPLKVTKRDKPLTSTLPPRTVLHVSKKMESVLSAASPTADPDEFSVLFDDRATTVFSSVKVTAQRLSPPRKAESPEPGMKVQTGQPEGSN